MADGSSRGIHAAALAELPECGAVCLTRLLVGSSPAEVWSSIVGGAHVGEESSRARARWREHARAVDLGHLAARLERHDAFVTTHHDSDHPAALVDDIEPAPVLFRRGHPPDAAAPTAAIVGTRRCTPTGREIAEELGFGLAREGVVVVSGLALGVDGAAHRGSLRGLGAPPVAVVGCGLDVVYPRRNGDLWRRVGEVGALLTEWPLGTRPEPWRFPARNRIIAALADVVVVVESKLAGGSMITVEHAIRRGRSVLAVPGSVRNPAAAGTNLLISEGCQPVCGVEDVLVALDLATAGPGPRLLTDDGMPPSPSADVDDAADQTPLEREIIGSIDFDGATLDDLAELAAAPVGSVAAAVVRLEQQGLVTLVDGLVRRRVAPSATMGGVTDTGCEAVRSSG